MHILFLSDNFPPETNAAATRVYERAVYWVRDGHQVTVITSAPNFPQGKVYDGYENRWYQVEMRDGIRVVRVKTLIAANRGTILRMLDFLSFMATGSVAALIQSRPDVVAATSPQFFSAVAGWMVGLARRKPFVFELGDIWPASIIGVGAMRKNLGLTLLEKLELFLYRQSAAVVALTHAFKDNLTQRGIDPGKIWVVRNGVDLSRYAPRPRDHDLAGQWGVDGKFVVGYVGTHGMAHGLMNVLDAAEHLRDDDRIRFLLVGDGAERQMILAERDRRNLTNVVMQGPQPKDMMPRIWSLCDLALVHLRDTPVFAEVIPSKIFEAMGMGLPVLLAAPVGEAKTVVDEMQGGVWVPPENPAALADQVRALANDPNRVKTLAAQALAAAPDYSRQAQADGMMAVLEQVAGSSRV